MSQLDRGYPGRRRRFNSHLCVSRPRDFQGSKFSYFLLHVAVFGFAKWRLSFRAAKLSILFLPNLHYMPWLVQIINIAPVSLIFFRHQDGTSEQLRLLAVQILYRPQSVLDNTSEWLKLHNKFCSFGRERKLSGVFMDAHGSGSSFPFPWSSKVWSVCSCA